jgi:hypothetical protein
VLLNVFAYKESNTRECCVFIRDLGYANSRPFSPSENNVTTLHKEQVRTCSNAVRLPMRLLRGF